MFYSLSDFFVCFNLARLIVDSVTFLLTHPLKPIPAAAFYPDRPIDL